MFLSEMLNGVRVSKMFSMVYGRTLVIQDLQITGVEYDSRKVRMGNIFVAIRGGLTDGHLFIDNAVQNGAAAVVLEDDAVRSDYYFLHAGVVKIVVPDARRALALLAANFYGRPSAKLRLVGVTGTNGKTTTTHLIASILEACGEKVGLIGTIDYVIGEKRFPATHTTPESLEMNQLLARMVEEGCTAAVMEVSSHALVQNRVAGLDFQVGVFTNLTQDHLDFHGTMDAYFQAKKLLFEGLSSSAHAVINRDDPYGDAIVAGCAAPVISYAWGARADVMARDVSISINGSRLLVATDRETVEIRSPLIGRFNVANILAACAAGMAMGCPPDQIARGIARVHSVRGRFEQIPSPQGWTAIVDYAHTPDALENCLRTVADIQSPAPSGKIITVFGCGGNRDTGKRPIMGTIASSMSDVVIVTSDNPRNEDPGTIINQIMAGVVPGAEVHAVVDRREGIRLGLSMARGGDVVLIAGKGHETYQVIGSTKSHFDDREEVERFISGAS
jgi:UDP-N-acetylmuramoyl-L-alanyl-D-glutamate--2,6-diaminopimelate ligase